jgi:gas vesicle protein
MHVVRTALAGLLMGAAVGFVFALLRPQRRSPYTAQAAMSGSR